MLYRFFLVLLALNLVVGVLGANKVFADDLERYLDQRSVLQIGVENANVKPTEVSNRESAELLVGRLGSHLFKGVGSWFGGASEERQTASLIHVLRESEFDLLLSDDDVLFSLSYSF